ncbi:MAG TPA: 16S rRNA (guanine(966)-N(2))-methyltransferase RsmD [Solirubrobacteraceae bacterium]|nr:16S rRNA (guanine(966)-N(2))-methyltransferase RsmD [Solirubrobacteraceae bacterium]
MRVIAGDHRGRRLTAPRGEATRPTSDRVREALFSILGPRVAGARVLDLFAGSGALGIEALSRGAAEATFVDSDAAAVRAIRTNLTGIAGGTVHRQDARAFVRSAREHGRQYDLVFLDPPYRQGETLGRALSEPIAALLAPGGTVVTESDRRAPLDLPDLPLLDERRYGDTLIRLHAA